jgi:predicted HTH transcriptional regulator
MLKIMVDKIIKTISAIANNGSKAVGKVLIGVTDKDADAFRVKELDGIEPKKVGKRFVVGINREAKFLGLSPEKYFSKWKDAIKKSSLSQPLKDSIMSNMDFNAFYGLGIIVITIQPQRELSYVGEEVYWRNGDATEIAKTPKQIAGLAQRF